MQEDKLWHFLASMALLIIFYTCQSFCCCKKMICGLISASLMAFIVGIAKEAADAVSYEWPWCNPTCQFDIKDILADAAGIAAGCILVLLFRNCRGGIGKCNSESRSVSPAEDSQV
jgi:hypothetical protein